jgi:uncharacterized protein (TIGR00288 family)
VKQELNIALLIDCDNVSYRAIAGVLNELAKYGVTNIRRAYGDWKSPLMKGWEDQLHAFAIKPIQQFAYTTGKNATDAAMIIDAMDLLYTQRVDAFALMTSDSDFTPLVLRILTDGHKVYGFGEKKTPEAFVKACSLFIFTENLAVPDDEPAKAKEEKKDAKRSQKQLRGDTELVSTLRTAAEQTSGDDGWSNLGRVGHYISNKSSLSPVNYGYQKWSDLIRVSDLFDIEMRNDNTVMYIRDKREAVAKAK